VKSRYVASLFASFLSVALAACSGGGSTPPPTPISVSFLNQPPSSLNTSASTGVIAVVSNDSSNQGVTWKVNCAGASCGTINPASSASGGSATYTAPAAVPSPAAVTIIATSVADTTKSVSASITITAGPPQQISISFVTQPPSSMVVNSTTSVAASVSNDAKNGGVKWSVTCAGAQCGSFSSTTTGSGSPTTYTAPSTVPAPATVTLTATSVTDNTKSTSATIAITATQPSVLADGAYVYHLSGQDNNDNYYVIGAFNIKGGVITGGEQDFSDGLSKSTDPLVASGCSVSTTGGNIEIVLATGNTQIGVSGIETLRGTMVSNSRLLISEFDSYAAATGSLDLQTSTAAPSGGYAFAINGIDNTGDDNQLVIGGVLNFSGTSLSVANSVFDYNDAADNPLLGQSFASGEISAPDQFGRVTISLTPSQQSGVLSFVLVGYLVDGHTIQLVESHPDSLNADLGGTALAQGSKTGQFGTGSVTNATYVFGSLGQDSNGPVGLGGAFIFANGGNLSGLLSFNDLTNINGNSFSGANYRVDSTGRVSISSVVPSQMTNISLDFELYLDGNGNALALGADGIQQTVGLAYQQNGPLDYESNYAITAQGFLNGPTYEQPYGAVGPVNISSDNFNGFTDYTSQDQNLQTPPQLTPFDTYANTSLTGAEDTVNGNFNLDGLNSLGYSSSFGYYPIDGNRVLAIELDDNGLGVLMLESTTQAQ
jgi:hypothetical protein